MLFATKTLTTKTKTLSGALRASAC